MVTSPDGTITLGELLLADIELAGQYRACMTIHNGLIDAINLK